MKPLWENYFNKKNADSPVIQALQSVPVFNELTPKQFKEISRLIHKRNYKKGEIISSTQEESNLQKFFGLKIFYTCNYYGLKLS